MLRNKETLTIVIPVFNEADTLEEAIARLQQVCKENADELYVNLLFVNDGSKDASFEILKHYAGQSQCIQIISFSRNFGHQIAITAGLDVAEGDYVAVIDADLQDPPELLIDMYHTAKTGYDVVYGKRRRRDGETRFKIATATAFYRLFNYLCETEVPHDTGDFRLMSRRAVDAFKQMRERHRFVRGMVPWCGFSSVALEYDRAERYAGQTKYPLRKMIALAANAVFSFSKKPLTIAIYIGLATIGIGAILSSYMLYLKLFTDIPVAGLSAMLIALFFFSGIQIFLIGMVGEYIARIFEEVKRRPLYFVAETINI